ncbi:MAG: extensin family protein [Massilia sp.]|nr:extensin family protein [Massilia sp.]
MRYLALLLVLAILPNPVLAATPSWLSGILPVPHARPAHKPRPVPAAKPAAAKPVAAETPKPAENAAPVPLPRPRPEQRAPEPAPPPAAPAPAAAAPVTPGPAIAPAETPPAAPVNAAPQQPGAVEGESTTPAPPRIYQTACPAVITGQVKATPLPPINDGQCHEQSPLAVTGLLINGRTVEVKGGVTLNCEMASTLPGWVSQVDGYLAAKQNTKVKSISVGT